MPIHRKLKERRERERESEKKTRTEEDETRIVIPLLKSLSFAISEGVDREEM